MHIGFTDDQADQLESLKGALSLAAGGRLQVYPTTPTASYLSVRETSQSVSSAIDSNSTLDDLVVNVSDDEAGTAVHIGTPQVSQVNAILTEILSPNAPVAVKYDPGDGSLLSGRFRNKGRMRAGDATFIQKFSGDTPSVHKGNKMCTAGFAAKDNAGESRGQAIWRLFVLTAGHCHGLTSVWERNSYRSLDSIPANETSWKKLGEVRRDALHHFDGVSTDASAIRVHGNGIVPQGIFG